MADFEFNLTEVLLKAAQVVNTRIAVQIPVKTGKLKQSFKVGVQGEQIFVTYEDYGVYTNYGTGPYYQGGFGEGWDAGEFAGYKRGTQGIQAQKWSSLPIDAETEIALMIEEEIARQTEAAIEQAFNNL
jgi:hypothetical protein